MSCVSFSSKRFTSHSHPHPSPSSPHTPLSLCRCLFLHQREQQREQRLQQREGRQQGQHNGKAPPPHSTAFSRVQPGEEGGDHDQRLPPPRTPSTPVDLRDTAGLPRLTGLAGLADLRLEQLGDQLGDVASSLSADPLEMSSMSPSDSTMRGGGGGGPSDPSDSYFEQSAINQHQSPLSQHDGSLRSSHNLLPTSLSSSSSSSNSSMHDAQLARTERSRVPRGQGAGVAVNMGRDAARSPRSPHSPQTSQRRPLDASHPHDYYGESPQSKDRRIEGLADMVARLERELQAERETRDIKIDTAVNEAMREQRPHQKHTPGDLTSELSGLEGVDAEGAGSTHIIHQLVAKVQGLTARLEVRGWPDCSRMCVCVCVCVFGGAWWSQYCVCR